MEDHISNLNKERLKSVVDKYHRKLVFIKMPSQEEVYPGVTVNLGRTYARMALGEILPKSVDRVLSLDSDTLVMDSLHEMYNVEFAENEYVAGVYDCVGQAIQKKVLHVPDDLAYCNAGVFLIDLNKWRAENVGQKLLESVLKNADGKHIMYFLEQDLMNLTFYGHLKVLNPRYNMITSVCYFDYDEVIKMKRPVIYYDKKTVDTHEYDVHGVVLLVFIYSAAPPKFMPNLCGIIAVHSHRCVIECCQQVLLDVPNLSAVFF